MIGCVCAGFYDRYEGAGTKGAAMIHRINMASRKKAGSGVQEKGANGKQLAKHKDGPIGRFFVLVHI